VQEFAMKECVVLSKMKFFIFLLFIIIISGNVMAVGFSPGSLTYKLNVGEKKCQMITINSDSELITLSDKWAENKDIEWRVSKFDRNADNHSLSLSYPKDLTMDKRNAEICLTGKKQGEYHGVLLLTEKEKGNLRAQMGVWINAIISNGINEVKNEEKSIIIRETIFGKNESNIENKKEENIEVINENSSEALTGKAISKEGKVIDKRIFWAIAILIISFMLMLIKSYKKENNEK
jgi:hypothetical protein